MKLVRPLISANPARHENCPLNRWHLCDKSNRDLAAISMDIARSQQWRGEIKMRKTISAVWRIVPSILIGIVGLAGVAMSTNVATAATYYVATNGNDSNPCTLAAPCLTFAHGITRLAAGDALLLRGGTYNENFDGNSQSIP